jgi:response regulator RpfG family c-di-GMP phosphodiesterase
MPPAATVSCLVVDDEFHVRNVLARVLESQGYAVRQAGSAREAIAELARQPADLVLSDIQMPGMDGVALLAEVQGRWPDTGVVMITGVSEVDTAVQCLQQGALDYLGKPFRVEDVVARVRQALQHRRLRIENRAYQTDLESRVEQQASRLRELLIQGVQALAHALEAKDAYTRGHSRRVAEYATAMAGALRLAPALVQEVRLGAELHDIGKIGVREAVLLKPGRLSEEEYAHIKEHPVIGERILAPFLADHPTVLAIARSHHERPDGKGFPDGLTGERIPLAARIVAVADTFDAMTTARPYRTPRPVAQAMDELHRYRGTQFDPDAVAAFLRAFPDPAQLPVSGEGLREAAS